MTAAIPQWLDVSRETIDKLKHFSAEVVRWNSAINLISKASVADIWHRHVLDSAQLFPLGASDAGVWVDMGSGAGFPGIVLTIMGAPQMVMVESDLRKATFLRQMLRQLDLQAQVISKRIDSFAPLAAQTVSARALASLTALLSHATPHLSETGRAIFPKGRGFEDELRAAQQDWMFELTRMPSKTDPLAVIAVLENIRRR